MISGIHKKLAIGIKTFMREDCLIHLLQSIDQFLPDLMVYIADDSETIRENKYDYLRGEHVIIRLPFDSGLSLGRNKLMEHIKEPYVLYCDDDYIFGKDNGVAETLKTIESRPDIGMITGLLTCDGVETGFESNLGGWEENIRRTDKGLNFFIARTEMFQDIRWNPKYKINDEHEDFFRRTKKTKWKIYYSPTLRAEHKIMFGSAEYEKYRRRNQ